KMDGFVSGSSALSSDGNTLYFFSNRPGGFGGYDLYMSTRLDGGPGPAPAGHRHPGVDPSLVPMLASISGPNERIMSGSVYVITAGQGNSVSAQQTPESQPGALLATTSSLAASSPPRQTTARILAARARGTPAREPSRWGM